MAGYAGLGSPKRDAGYVRTAGEAARLRDDLKRDLHQQTQAPGSWRAEARETIGDLERGWPEIMGVPFGEGRELSARDRRYHASGHATTRHGRNRPAHSGSAPPPSSSQRAPVRQRAAAAIKGGLQERRGQAARAGQRAQRRAGRATSKAWGQTGIPGAAASTTATIMQGVGTFVGLTIAYVLLTGRGPTALADVFKGAAGAFHALLSPDVDPLRPKATGKPVKAASGPTGPPARRPPTHVARDVTGGLGDVTGALGGLGTATGGRHRHPATNHN